MNGPKVENNAVHLIELAEISRSISIGFHDGDTIQAKIPLVIIMAKIMETDVEATRVEIDRFLRICLKINVRSWSNI